MEDVFVFIAIVCDAPPGFHGFHSVEKVGGKICIPRKATTVLSASPLSG